MQFCPVALRQLMQELDSLPVVVMWTSDCMVQLMHPSKPFRVRPSPTFRYGTWPKSRPPVGSQTRAKSCHSFGKSTRYRTFE